MNFKRVAALALSLTLALGLLASCSQKPAAVPSKTPEELTQLYVDAINNCGNEMVEYNTPISVYDPENDPMIDVILTDTLKLTPEDLTAFAISVSLMNVKAYGIAVIMPAEGKEQAVVDGLKGYVTLMQSNFETYLVDQYEIAQAAKVEVLADGSVVMVMCENSDAVYDSIVAALAA